MWYRWRGRLGRTWRQGLDPWTELLLTLVTAVVVALTILHVLGLRLRPLAAAAAKTQAENTVTRLVEEAVLADLTQCGVGYGDFVRVERNASGSITALTCDMAALNRLRGQLLEAVLGELEGIRVSDIQIPLGSLLDLDILWAKGPSIKVHNMSVGTVMAEFESEFTSAGINQTIHRIWLQVEVPLELILPHDRVETVVTTRLCVAETVIVGQVPDAYLQTASP